MEQFIGLDVSLKETHICVVDGAGEVVARGREATQPERLAKAIGDLAPEARVVVLETGGQSSWLQRELSARGTPAVIVDARRAKAALSCRMNKTDANDAEGLAQLARTGWYREVAAKRPETRLTRSLLLARRQMAKQRRDLENQVRALLRGFGLPVGTVAQNRFEGRVRTLVKQEPLLKDAVEALLSVRRSLCLHIGKLEARIGKVAGESDVCRRLMTVPGVGPMTALAFVTAIDNPGRFAKSASVGAYLGLTPKRHQSGAVDWSGRISKHGDGLARHMLYEAANSLLCRARRWSVPKAWAARMVKRIGGKKARVALARKLAVILHRIWADGSTFRWTNEVTA
ncbi:MAG: IS110 family transposase [Leptospirillia bacterium]